MQRDFEKENVDYEAYHRSWVIEGGNYRWFLELKSPTHENLTQESHHRNDANQQNDDPIVNCRHLFIYHFFWRGLFQVKFMGKDVKYWTHECASTGKPKGTNRIMNVLPHNSHAKHSCWATNCASQSKYWTYQKVLAAVFFLNKIITFLVGIKVLLSPRIINDQYSNKCCNKAQNVIFCQFFLNEEKGKNCCPNWQCKKDAIGRRHRHILHTCPHSLNTRIAN